MAGKANGLGPHRNWWWTFGAPTVGLILMTVGPIGFVYGLERREWEFSARLMWLSGLLFLAGAGLTIWDKVRSERAARKQTRGLTHYNDRLKSLIDAVVDLVMSDRNPAAREQFFKTAVAQASSLFMLDGVRVCVYELDAGERSDRNQEPDPYLRLVHSGGRADEPRTEFRGDSEYGAAAIEAANGTTHVNVNNFAKPGRRIDRSPNAVWQAFFAVPLRENHHPRGLLTVDTRDKTKFSSDDIAIARTVAQFIVLGMSSLMEGAIDTSREVRRVAQQIQEMSAP